MADSDVPLFIYIYCAGAFHRWWHNGSADILSWLITAVVMTYVINFITLYCPQGVQRYVPLLYVSVDATLKVYSLVYQ